MTVVARLIVIFGQIIALIYVKKRNVANNVYKKVKSHYNAYLRMQFSRIRGGLRLHLLCLALSLLFLLYLRQMVT